MSFMLGFLIGMFTAAFLFGLLLCWLFSRPNNIAVAKFVNGIAQALAHKRRPIHDDNADSKQYTPMQNDDGARPGCR